MEPEAKLTSSVNLEISEESQAVIDQIKSKLPQDIVLLHVAILGSRAKGMASSNSDFDTKVIIMHPKSNYLL